MKTDLKSNKPKTLERGKSYLMHMVAKSPKTEQQVREKLQRSDYSNDIIDAVIEFAKSYDFIDDKEYAKLWLKGQAHVKQVGSFKCKQELIRKGIDSGLVEMLVDDYFADSEVSEQELALSYLQKKSHQIKGKDAFQRKQKANQILVRRGFSFGIIEATLNDFFE